jgi:hypothetical protein
MMHGSLLVVLTEAAEVVGLITDIGAPFCRGLLIVRRREIAEHQREVNATLRKRTGLTLQFNRLLGARSRALGFHLTHLDASSAGPDGLVRRGLLNAPLRITTLC